jgi:hypothetical protein
MRDRLTVAKARDERVGDCGNSELAHWQSSRLPRRMARPAQDSLRVPKLLGRHSARAPAGRSCPRGLPRRPPRGPAGLAYGRHWRWPGRPGRRRTWRIPRRYDDSDAQKFATRIRPAHLRPTKRRPAQIFDSSWILQNRVTETNPRHSMTTGCRHEQQHERNSIVHPPAWTQRIAPP